jgi:Spy/CpxP family protein refolding chaperone
MHRTTWKMSSLALVLALALAGGVQAQQHEQHHPGSVQMSQDQTTRETQETPAQAPMMQSTQGMMEQMQGMMQQMQGMMQQMQGMMGRGGMMMGPGGMQGWMGPGSMMGMTGPGGMMAEEAEHEDDEGTSWGGMMGHHGMLGGGHMMGHGGMFQGLLERLAQQLDLTEEQATQVRALVRAHLKEAIRAQADLAVKRIDLRDLLDTEPVDLPRVKDLLQTMASQRADLRFAHITLMQDITKLLTPAQQEKFRTLRGQMLRGRGGMAGPGRLRGRRGIPGQGRMRNPCFTR